jgi:hypothetical protein
MLFTIFKAAFKCYIFNTNNSRTPPNKNPILNQYLCKVVLEMLSAFQVLPNMYAQFFSENVALE